jgi:hypothetical protein
MCPARTIELHRRLSRRSTRAIQRRSWRIAIREIRLDPEAYFDFGEHTLAFYVAKGRGRQSGVQVAQSAGHVAKWRASLCVHARAYVHREDALTDLGISETALEPIAP